MKTIIAITGIKRSGKNTVAKFISEYFIEKKNWASNSTLFLAFGDAVKETVAAIIGVDKDYFKNDISKNELFTFWDEKTYTGRELLQIIGTEALRDNFNQFVWITNLHRKFSLSSYTLNIITDLRFQNEYNYLKKLKDNVIILKVVCDSDGSIDNHRSENEMNNFKYDYEIVNNSTLKELKTATYALCNKFNINE